MNRSQLAGVIRKEHGYSKAQSSRILNTVIDAIRSELKNNRLVRLRNFGTFQARKTRGKIRAKFDDSKNFFR